MSLVLAISTARAQVSQMVFTLPEGPYRAGFRAVQQYDRTRTFEGDLSLGVQPRPLQTSIWYPTHSLGTARPTAYKEYAYLTASETSFPVMTAALRQRTIESFANDWGLTDSTRRHNELEAPTRAYPGAPPASGSFPVIVYGPAGNGNSFDNSVLAEYLASYGYIVVSSPSMGWHSRSMTFDPLGIEAEARDMEFLLDFARSLPGADTSRVGAMGYSWGGLSDVVFQLRNPLVKALVSLDGAIWSDWKIFTATSTTDMDRMDVPFLFLNQQPLPPDTAIKYGLESFVFFDSLRYSDAYLVRFNQLRHRNFAAQLIRLFPRSREGGFSEADQATVNYGYEQVARYVLNFLNAYLRNDARARVFLAREPVENGVRPGFATMQRKTARHPAPTLLAFSRSLGAAGPAAAPEALAVIRKTNPGYRLPEDAVNYWGVNLSRAGRYDEGIGVLKVNTMLYPRSSNAWDSLGGAYVRKGERDLAIASYEKSLALDSTNTNAVHRLAKLRGP
jgi:tetratricopeptide (TPR) repeat protein